MCRSSNSPRGIHGPRPAASFRAPRFALLSAFLLAVMAMLAAHVTPASAQSPAVATLLHDLDPRRDATVSSEPGYFATIGATTYFSARSSDGGRYLWASDGTAAGTRQIVDAALGPLNDPDVGGGNCGFAASADALFFCAAGGVWRSDGTATGSYPLTIHPINGAHGFDNLTVVGTRLFFSSSRTFSSSNSAALWVSDGTPDGTVQLRAFSNDVPHLMAAAGDRLFFVAAGAIWTSDGTTAGTQPVFSGFVRGLAVFRGALYFGVYTGTNLSDIGLWRSDGTPAGTVRISDVVPDWPMEVAGDTLYFANDKLWKTDGTTQGTVVASDNVSRPIERLIAAGSRLYIVSTSPLGGAELWVSDGSDAGTTSVKQFEPGFDSQRVPYTVAIGEALYLVVRAWGAGGQASSRVWRSDGTPAGTAIVWDNDGHELGRLHNAGGKLMFACWTEQAGAELCRSDGTIAGTGLLKDIYIDYNTTAWPRQFVAAANKLFWVPDTSDAELWASDGTAQGSGLLKDIRTGSNGSDPRFLTPFDGKLFFSAATLQHGRELWSSDGTGAGTVLFKDLAAGVGGSEPHSLTVVGSRLFFFTSDGAQVPRFALWSSDGSATGTVLIKQWPAAPNTLPLRSEPGSTALFFWIDDGTHGRELWTSDGTPSGTRLVKDLSPGAESSEPWAAATRGDELFFAARSMPCSCSPLLWKTDGSTAGTAVVKQLADEADTPIAGPFKTVGGTLYFRLLEAWTRSSFWASDGTAQGTRFLQPGAESTLVQAGGRVLYAASDAAHGTELWSSDGTPQGTVLVADIMPGPNSALDLYLNDEAFRSLSPLREAVVLPALTRQAGYEPWISDATAAGTLLLADLNPGPASSGRQWSAVVGTTLFLTVANSSVGAAIWGIDLAAVPPAPPNRAPVAPSASLTVAAGETLNGILPGSDADGEPLQFSIVQQGSKGTASIVDPARGTFRYVSQTDASGVDSFQYRVSDGRLEATGSVKIEIRSAAAPGGRAWVPGVFR